VKYDRELWTKTIDAIKRVNQIKERREKHYVMVRLRIGTQREIHNDVRDVQKIIALIRTPEGLRKKDRDEEQNKTMEVEDEEVEYMYTRAMENKLSSGVLKVDAEMLANQTTTSIN
jgi:large subunit ribosomal protein L24e